MRVLQAANRQVRARAALRDAGLAAAPRRSGRWRRRRSRSPRSSPSTARREKRGGFAFFAVILLYGQLIGFGYFVAMGVVEEKASRVVEVLLVHDPAAPSARRARSSASGVLGLGQLLVLAVLGLGMAGAAGRARHRRAT